MRASSGYKGLQRVESSWCWYVACDTGSFLYQKLIKIRPMKKRSEATQTLRAGCSKAEPKVFAPPQTPFPGARDGQNLISWRRSLPSPTNPVWWRSMHAISSYRGNRPTNTPTNTHKTDRQDRLQYTAPQLASAQCNYSYVVDISVSDRDRNVNNVRIIGCVLIKMKRSPTEWMCLLTLYRVSSDFRSCASWRSATTRSVDCRQMSPTSPSSRSWT